MLFRSGSDIIPPRTPTRGKPSLTTVRSIEGIEADFGAIHSAEPDGPATDQIADDDPVCVAWTDGEFVDADDLGARLTDAGQLLAHVLLVEFLDGMPVEVEVLRDILDGGESAVASDTDGESLGEVWIVGEPIEPFAFHVPALPT